MTSRFIFGLGSIHHIFSPNKRQHLIESAIEVGFRKFDVAPAYGNGLNEIELGLALRRHRRDNFKITTKYGIPVCLYGAVSRSLFYAFRLTDKLLNPFHGKPYQKRRFFPSHMEQSIAGSLRRLRTDYVDLFLIHEPLSPIPDHEFEGIVAAAERLKERGLIKAFGVAGHIQPTRGLLTHPIVQTVQAPLSDVMSLKGKVSLDMIAYGLYKYYANHRADGASFAGFIEGLVSHLPDTGLILSTTSESTLLTFKEFLA